MTRDVSIVARRNSNFRMFQIDLDQKDTHRTTNERSKATLTTFVWLDAGFECNLYVEEAPLS